MTGHAIEHQVRFVAEITVGFEDRPDWMQSEWWPVWCTMVESTERAIHDALDAPSER